MWSRKNEKLYRTRDSCIHAGVKVHCTDVLICHCKMDLEILSTSKICCDVIFFKTKHKPQVICVQTLQKIPFVKNSIFLIFIPPSFGLIPVYGSQCGSKIESNPDPIPSLCISAFLFSKLAWLHLRISQLKKQIIWVTQATIAVYGPQIAAWHFEK